MNTSNSHQEVGETLKRYQKELKRIRTLRWELMTIASNPIKRLGKLKDTRKNSFFNQKDVCLIAQLKMTIASNSHKEGLGNSAAFGPVWELLQSKCWTYHLMGASSKVSSGWEPFGETCVTTHSYILKKYLKKLIPCNNVCRLK